MTGLGGRLRGRLRDWLKVGERPSPGPAAARPVRQASPDLLRLAHALADHAACPPELLDALSDLIRFRRSQAGLEDGPDAPQVSDLRIRRSGLPDWWSEGQNLLLAGEAALIPDLGIDPLLGAPRRSIVALGRDSRFARITTGGEGALVVIGNGVIAPAAALSCSGPSSLLLGEGTTCTNSAVLDCRNGGMILAGSDGMWAHGIALNTDDAHAIRDVKTGRRLNAYGGRIVVDHHVWLGEHALLVDGARVGAGAVVGSGALVGSAAVNANTVVVGVPARPVRSDVSWTREDRP